MYVLNIELKFKFVYASVLSIPIPFELVCAYSRQNHMLVCAKNVCVCVCIYIWHETSQQKQKLYLLTIYSIILWFATGNINSASNLFI